MFANNDTPELDDLGVEPDIPDEKPAFKISDDRTADWAVRKIKELNSEIKRLTELADASKAQITSEITTTLAQKTAPHKRSMEYFASLLYEYFEQVPHRKTKTQEKYDLIAGDIIEKYGTPDPVKDNEKLVSFLKENGFGEYVKVVEEAKWGEFSKKLNYINGSAVLADTGEIVEGITVKRKPGTFNVRIDGKVVYSVPLREKEAE